MNETIKRYFRYTDQSKKYHYRGYFMWRGIRNRHRNIVLIGMVRNRMEVKKIWRLKKRG